MASGKWQVASGRWQMAQIAESASEDADGQGSRRASEDAHSAGGTGGLAAVGLNLLKERAGEAVVGRQQRRP